MNTTIFKRRAVATAVTAALTAGMTGSAFAANLAGTGSAFPKYDTDVFVGGTGSNLRLLNTGTAEEQVRATIFYFDDAGAAAPTTANALGTSLTQIDTSPANDTEILINISSNVPAGATKAIVVVDTQSTGPGSDDINGGDFGYVADNGNMEGCVAPGCLSVDVALAEAAANNGVLDVRDDYQRLSVTDARVNADTNTEVLYVTFNADPVTPAPLAAGGDLAGTAGGIAVVEQGLDSSPQDVVVSTAIATPAEFIKAIIDDTGANAAGTLRAAVEAWDPSDPASVANASGLDDGAGNVPLALATITPIPELAAPSYATAGEVAITLGLASALYDGGTGGVSLRIRMNEAVEAGTWNAPDDVTVTRASGGAAGTVATAGVSADADGQNTILNANVTAAGGNLFFIDPATGDLTYGMDRDSAEPVSVAVTVGATPLALALDNSVEIASDLTAQQAKAGVAPAPVLVTQDSDQDGWIDGGLYDFQIPVDLGAAPALGMVSYPDGTPVEPDDRVVLTTTAPVTVSDSTIQVLLANADVPNSDGTAPDTASNDYDGSGTVDEADAAVVIGDNLNTGVFSTLNGGAGVPWAGFVGACSICAVDPADAETSVTYVNVFDSQTGEALGVDTGVVEFGEDGAAPVVTSVGWTKTGSMTCGSETVDYGVVTIQASEDVKAVPGIVDNSRDTINEFMFDGNGPDLINDAACSPGELPTVEKNIGQTENTDTDLDGEDDQILLSNVPFSVVGTDLSLGTTGGAVDIVPELPLFVLPNSDTTTVVEPEPEGPQVDYETAGPEVTPILVDGNWTHIVVHYDQVVEAPDGQNDSDLDNVFKVRAQVGWDSTGGNTDNEQEVFQWIIAGDDVSVGADGLGGAETVTLRLPNGEVLPEDTFKVWVDYQGASQDEIDGGSLSYIQNEAGRPAKIDGGTQFDDDDNGAGLDVPMKFTSTGGTDTDAGPTVYGDTEDDEDTGSSDEFEAPFISLGGREDDQRNLFTQTVKGVITYDGAPVFEGTAVRADIVRLREYSDYTQLTQNAVVGDGFIDIRQGSNTEYNFYECGGECGENWVTMAMKNSAVTGSDFDKYAKDLQKISDKSAEYYSAVNNNLSSKATDQLYMELQQLLIKFEQAYVDGEYILGYVEVTHGDGGKAAAAGIDSDDNDNNAMANGNASYGSTATLRRNIPNTQRNGTRYYPVRISMDDGEVDSVGRTPTDSRNVRDGALNLIAEPIVGDSYPGGSVFEVVDTAYALTGPNGTYRVTVGMDEASLDKKSTGNDLQPEHDDACIMIKVKRTNRLGKPSDGEWAQANMCEPSFTSYLPFEGDLQRDGTPTMLNVEMMNIKGMKLFDDGDWELVPVPGTPDRVEDAKDLDLPWFFLQSRPSDGAPVTLWQHDGRYDDRVFALGLNEGSGNKKQPAVQLAFELGDSNDNSNVGSLDIRPGSALGFHGDRDYVNESGVSYYRDSNDTGDDVSGSMDRYSDTMHRLFIPMTGGSQDGFLAGEAWHLVTFGSGQTLADIVTRYPEIDAIIMFNNPFNNYNAGRDDSGDDRLDGDLDTTVWFKGEDAPAGTLSSATGAFIYVADDVDGFNVDTVSTPTPQ